MRIEKKIKTWPVPQRKCNRIYEAKSLAVLKAVERGNNIREEYTIDQDCQSVIQVLSKHFDANEIIDNT